MKDFMEFMYSGDYNHCKDILKQYDEVTITSFVCALFDSLEAERDDFDTLEALKNMYDSAVEVHEIFGKLKKEE